MKYVSIVLVCLILVVGFAGSFSTGETPVAASEKVRWEYTVFSFDFAARGGDNRKLNELGEDGWELVAIESSANPQLAIGAYIFKRKKQ